MDEILALMEDLRGADLISMAACIRIEKALLRLHAASPRSARPPITHGPESRIEKVELYRRDTILVCGKCGTHYIDQY